MFNIFEQVWFRDGSIFDFWIPHLQQWLYLNSKLEESTSETQGLKE